MFLKELDEVVQERVVTGLQRLITSESHLMTLDVNLAFALRVLALRPASQLDRPVSAPFPLSRVHSHSERNYSYYGALEPTLLVVRPKKHLPRDAEGRAPRVHSGVLYPRG